MGQLVDNFAFDNCQVRISHIIQRFAIKFVICLLAIPAITSSLANASPTLKNITDYSTDYSLENGQGYLIAGFGTSDFSSPNKLNSYQGAIYAPFSSLSETGLILRGWNKAYRFTYETDLAANAQNIEISVLGLSVEGEVGWQFSGQLGRIALYGGIVWRDHLLTPDDPGSSLGKSRLGFSATLDGEYKINDNYGIMANTSFLQGFNQYWAQIKPYVKLGDGWKVGFDGASSGGKTYNVSRAGLFISDFEFSLWPKSWSQKRIFLGAEAGAQFSFKDNQFSPYAGLNVGYLF